MREASTNWNKMVRIQSVQRELQSAIPVESVVPVCCAIRSVRRHASRGVVAHMAEDNGISPLPRRVRGAADSPRPPARIEQPVLPESVRQHVLVVLAGEQERAAREPVAPQQEEEGEEAASQAQPTAPDGPGPPPERAPFREQKAPPERAAALGKAGSPHKAGHPEPVASAEQFVPLPRRPPGAHGGPARSPVTSRDAVPAPPLVGQAEALTQPIPRVPALENRNPSALVSPGVTEAAPRPERPASVPDTPTAAVPDTCAAAVSAPNVRVVGRRQRRPGRRYRMAGVLFSVAALITAGSLALTLYGHSASAVAPRGHRQLPASGEDPVVRDQAAAWVAGQIGRTTIVSADPAMCLVLESHGVPARNLYELGPEATNPLHSTVLVATPAVRAQFGTLLSSVYAPAVLASFGSGRQRVEIRGIAPRGAAAYRSMLAADLAARKSTAAELLLSNRINVSPTARKQFSAGQVDSRLEITVAAMAAKRPIYIVAFNSFAPGADADMPLRFADMTQESSGRLVANRSATLAFLRSMTAFLRTQPARYQPLRVETVRLADGQTVLRIGFAAPSPLGLFGLP